VSAAVVALLLVLGLVLHRRRRNHRSVRARSDAVPSEHDERDKEPTDPAELAPPQILETNAQGQTVLSYRGSLDASPARRLAETMHVEPFAWGEAQRGETSMAASAHPGQANAAVVEQQQQQRALEKLDPPASLAPASEQSEETRTTAGADSGISVMQQQLRALEKIARPEAEVSPSETSAGPSAPADVAVLQGEIHRLRAALLEQSGQRGADEQPPAYH
jgi:hypothetical protein